MKDPYATLGVSPDASKEEIKKAYKDLALKWHPDRHQGDKKAEERFKEISEAYNLLKDGKYNPYVQSGPTGFDSFNINEMFNHAFGGFGFSFRTQQRVKTGNMAISIEEAHGGCKRKIRLSEVHGCADCRNVGRVITQEVCDKCGGSGQVRSAMGAIHIARPCDACGGYGRKLGDNCNSCNGQGKKEIHKELEVNVPPGILHGQKVYPQSNLQITILYKPHSYFKLLDENTGQIGSNITIDMFDAIFGNNVEIDTLNGRKSLKINPGTQPGAILRIKRGGVGGRADHLVNINVILPKDLNEKQKELLQKLQKTMGE